MIKRHNLVILLLVLILVNVTFSNIRKNVKLKEKKKESVEKYEEQFSFENRFVVTKGYIGINEVLGLSEKYGYTLVDVKSNEINTFFIFKKND